jgi:hypothetical protein
LERGERGGEEERKNGAGLKALRAENRKTARQAKPSSAHARAERRTRSSGGRRGVRKEARARDDTRVRERAKDRERRAAERRIELAGAGLRGLHRDEEQLDLPPVEAPARELLACTHRHVRHVLAALERQLGEDLAVKGSVAHALDEDVLRGGAGENSVL